MSDAVAAPAKAKATPKKKVSKPKVAAAHPKFSAMVAAAIGALKDRKGSSKIAIQKYIIANYKGLGINENKISANIKKALKAGVAAKELKQVKGVGASGSFKLGDKPEKVKKPKAKKPAAKKPAGKKPKAKSTTPKKPKAKKAKTPKKAPAKKAKSPKKTAAKKVKTPKKVAKKPAAKKAAPKKN